MLIVDLTCTQYPGDILYYDSQLDTEQTVGAYYERLLVSAAIWDGAGRSDHRYTGQIIPCCVTEALCSRHHYPTAHGRARKTGNGDGAPKSQEQ